MGQYYLIANDERKEFIDPFELPSTASFPHLLSNDFISESLVWLSCNSDHSKWNDLKNNYYCSKHLGSWSESGYKVYGDYEHEGHSRFIRENYENITIEVIAMLFEVPTSIINYLDKLEELEQNYKQTLSKVALLEAAPENIVNTFKKVFGKDWKAFATKRAYK